MKNINWLKYEQFISGRSAHWRSVWVQKRNFPGPTVLSGTLWCFWHRLGIYFHRKSKVCFNASCRFFRAGKWKIIESIRSLAMSCKLQIANECCEGLRVASSRWFFSQASTSLESRTPTRPWLVTTENDYQVVQILRRWWTLTISFEFCVL